MNLLSHSRNPLNALPLYMVLHCDSIKMSYNSFIVDRNYTVVDRRPQAPRGRIFLQVELWIHLSELINYTFKKTNEKVYFENGGKKSNMRAIEIFTLVAVTRSPASKSFICTRRSRTSFTVSELKQPVTMFELVQTLRLICQLQNNCSEQVAHLNGVLCCFWKLEVELNRICFDFFSATDVII